MCFCMVGMLMMWFSVLVVVLLFIVLMSVVMLYSDSLDVCSRY